MEITPDRSFMRDLRLMDRRLGVKWNGKNFVVTFERPHGEPANIHLVKGDDGGFRQPDRRDLEFIKSGDLENEGLKNRLNRLSYHCETVREQLRRRATDDIKHMTRDNKTQLINTVLKKANARKANSAFRRISPKRKGKTIEEIRQGAQSA